MEMRISNMQRHLGHLILESVFSRRAIETFIDFAQNTELKIASEFYP